MSGANSRSFRIDHVALDEGIVFRTAEIEQESNVAIYDLLQENQFKPAGSSGGPYHIFLRMADDRLMLEVRLEDGVEHGRVALALSPFRRVLKDYRALCDSYYVAIREASPARIEAIDMGRRGLHDEGSTLLQERLTGKIEMDFATARRLFTLISVLHMKG
jgi:uncharacterized protein (UPF0262 family)